MQSEIVQKSNYGRRVDTRNPITTLAIRKALIEWDHLISVNINLGSKYLELVE